MVKTITGQSEFHEAILLTLNCMGFPWVGDSICIDEPVLSFEHILYHLLHSQVEEGCLSYFWPKDLETDPVSLSSVFHLSLALGYQDPCLHRGSSITPCWMPCKQLLPTLFPAFSKTEDPNTLLVHLSSKSTHMWEVLCIKPDAAHTKGQYNDGKSRLWGWI